MTFKLDRAGAVPPGMVRVRGIAQSIGLTGLDHLQLGPVEDFFIDRYEVTNEEYAKFVNAGGYRRPEYWKYPFVKDGKVLTFEEATQEFRDTTGRPGPATWEVGSYPAAKANLPVTGVSWHEAAAYAAFAGKDLPTVHHWLRAAVRTSLVLNSSPGPAVEQFHRRRAGRGRHESGHESIRHVRYGRERQGMVCERSERPQAVRVSFLAAPTASLLYMAHDPDAQSPFGRLAAYGFRLVEYHVAAAGIVPGSNRLSIEGLRGREAGRGCRVRSDAALLRLRPHAARRQGRVGRRHESVVAPREDHVQDGLRCQSHGGLPLSPPQRRTAVSGGGPFSAVDRAT